MQKLLNGEPLSIVSWDLECTNLSAMIGRVLCCSFKPLGKPVYTFRGDERKLRGTDIVDDSKLVIAIRDELEHYDLIIGHNSKLFDAKFLEGRLFKAAARPREKRFHIDSMWTVRSNLRISSKLVNVQEFLELEDKKTPITWDNWARAAGFDRQGMDQVVKHCENDVIVLEAIYKKLRPYIKEFKIG